MNKKIVYFIIAVVIVVGGVLGFIYRDKLVILVMGNKLLLPPANLDIKTYSLGGSVITADESKIVFSAALVYQTLKGNVVEYHDKTAIIDADTKIQKTTPTGGYQPINISDIKPGMSVNVYYSSSPLGVDELKAEKVEITQ